MSYTPRFTLKMPKYFEPDESRLQYQRECHMIGNTGIVTTAMSGRITWRATWLVWYWPLHEHGGRAWLVKISKALINVGKVYARNRVTCVWQKIGIVEFFRFQNCIFFHVISRAQREARGRLPSYISWNLCNRPGKLHGGRYWPCFNLKFFLELVSSVEIRFSRLQLNGPKTWHQYKTCFVHRSTVVPPTCILRNRRFRIQLQAVIPEIRRHFPTQRHRSIILRRQENTGGYIFS